MIAAFHASACWRAATSCNWATASARRIWTAETDRTSAEDISKDKDLTKSLLQSCGVPIPKAAKSTSAEDAWEAAEDIGFPVCVKPLDGNHGRGVFIDEVLKR